MKQGLSYDDVLLVPERSGVDSRSDVDLSTELGNHTSMTFPVFSAPMDTVTEDNLALALDREGGIGIIHRYQSIGEQVGQVQEVMREGDSVAAAVGVDEKEMGSDYINRADRLVQAGIDILCIDVAHGHLEKVLDAVEKISERFENHEVDIMAGNVATASGVSDLVHAGADIIRVGIGNGSHCTTRKKTGVGVPQVTAIEDAMRGVRDVDVYHKMNNDEPPAISIVADGGITCPGDAAKALMLGADAVMIGGQLAACEESSAPVEEVEFSNLGSSGSKNRRFKVTRGQSRVGSGAIEGVEKHTPISGTVGEFAEEYRQGLKSAVSYCGADNIEDARTDVEFVKASPSTQDRNGDF